MAWKIINNSEPPFREVKNIVNCKKYHETATILAGYSGTKWKDTDLHKTYHLSGWKCELAQNINNGISSQCLDCPHKPDNYL